MIKFLYLRWVGVLGRVCGMASAIDTLPQ